jgi:hypothetical protein
MHTYPYTGNSVPHQPNSPCAVPIVYVQQRQRLQRQLQWT